MFKPLLFLFLLLFSSLSLAADPKHCVLVTHHAQWSERLSAASYVRPCQRSEYQDADRWKLYGALSYRPHKNIALSAGYSHEKKKYPAVMPEKEFWQQLRLEHATAIGQGFLCIKATTLDSRPASRLTLHSGVSRTLHDKVQLTLANELTLSTERSRRTRVNAAERNILTLSLGTDLSSRVKLIASYEHKQYFLNRAPAVHEANLSLIWRGHGVQLYRDIF